MVRGALMLPQVRRTDSCEIIGTKGKITFPFFGTFVTCKNEEGEETKLYPPRTYSATHDN
jgi:hypothetical protein